MSEFKSVFEKGEVNPFGQFFVGQSYLKMLTNLNGVGVANVTFEPGCRNNWHVHHAAKGGGQILDARTSPFGRALTEYQCIQYALDKPGVVTVLPGIRNEADLLRILGFCEASEAERDYSVIAGFAPKDAEGICVYCNHCQPCPMGLNVGLINKYYDLSLTGDHLATEHYYKLETRADACVACGHCNRRCPFHVDQMARMQKINEYFNEKREG